MKIKYKRPRSYYVLLIAAILILSLSNIVSAGIIDPSATGANSQSYSTNYESIISGSLLSNFNTTVQYTVSGTTYLTVPEFQSSTACLLSGSGLSNITYYGPGTPNSTVYEVRSDAYSEVGIALSMSNRSNEFDAWVNFLEIMDICGYGNLPCWIVLRNNTMGGNQVQLSGTRNDTALDGDIRAGIALYMAANNTNFTAENRTRYLNLAKNISRDVYRYDLVSITTKATRAGVNVTLLPFGGADCAALGLGCGTDMWIGYLGETIKFFQYSYIFTGNETYNAAAQNITAAAFSVSLQNDTDGDGFGVAPFNFNWDVSGTYLGHTNGGGVNSYYYSSANEQWDDSDAPRFMAFCDILRIQNLSVGSITGPYLNASTYCQAWANSGTYNATVTSLQYYYNGTCAANCLQSGYYTNGLGEQLSTYYNTTYLSAKVNETLSHYSWSGNTFDSTFCGTGLSFRGVKMTKGLGDAIGLSERWVGVSLGGGGNQNAFSGAINVTVHSPLNASVSTSGNITFNVTVWNLNNSDIQNNVNGTLPLTLYNSTFTANPSSDGWTMNSWDWSANDDGVINNSANSGGAAWTQNLTLTQMTNGYNISLNMSMSNFTNAKIFFGTNNGAQNGDRILLERNGNNINVKHDGGSFGSFSVAQSTYVTINIFINLSGNNVTVTSGGSRWSEALANNHLTVNGSYIAFVPGQNMSGTIALNQVGWNISSINVTNLGTPYNITNSTTGNSSMNVTVSFANGTIILQQNNTPNASTINTTLNNQADGSYSWYITVRSKDSVVNYSGLTYSVNTPQCSNDFAGADWNITTDTNITGYYCNIRDLIIQPNVTVTITSWNGTNMSGWAKINATRNVYIYGNITGDGGGYGGGSGGGGGNGDDNDCTSGSVGNGGSPTDQNGSDGSNGGSFVCNVRGGNGGSGGNGFNGTTAGSGGTGGTTSGSTAASSGSVGTNAQANYDISYADNASLGYGGGGAGGGGGARSISANGGAGGGGGGAGGDGGAALIIKSTNITISGVINLRTGQNTCSTASNGQSADGGAGGNAAANNNTNCAATSGGSGGTSPTTGLLGGNGGSGGAGAGGMLAVNATNTLNYTGAVFNVSGGSITNGGTVKLIYSTLIGSATISGASSTVVTPTYSIIVNLTNIVNASRINSYNYVLIGPTNLTGSNPGSNTIYTNNLGLYTLYLSDIDGGSYVDQNFTFTLTSANITANITTYQGLLNVSTRLLYLNTTITSFNITNVIYQNTTTTSSLIIPANNGTNNLQANVQGNYTVNGTCEATSLIVTQCAVQGVYDNIFKINATLDNGSQILNFTIQIVNSSIFASSLNVTTTNGSAYAPLLQGYIYTFSINNTLYAFSTTNLPANASTNFYQFSLSGSNLVNFTFYDEQNGSIVNGTNISLQVISDLQSQQYSTTTGRISTGPLLPGTYTLLYSASGYATRTSQFTLVDQTAPTINLSMLLEPESTEATVTVIDDYGVRMTGAVVKLHKKDIPSNSYLVNQIFTTDSNGQGVVTIQLTDTLYYWSVEISGNIVLTTTPSFLYSNAITLVVRGANNGFNTFQQNNDITGEITNTSNVYTFLYNDPDNTATQGCIYAWIYNYNNKALYNSTCAASSSGSVSLTINNNTGTYYLIQGYVTKNAVNNLIDTVTTQIRNLLNNENREKTGLFMLFFVLLIIIFIFRDTLRWAIIIGSFIPLIFSIFGFINVPVGVTGVLFIAGIIIGAIIGD